MSPKHGLHNHRIRLFTFIVFIILICAVQPISAQRGNPISQEKLEELQEILQQNGTAQVIIGLDVPFTPFGNLPNQAATQAQSQRLRQAQTQIGQFLNGFDAHPISTDWNIPYVAFEVNENALNGLINNPLVTHIQFNDEFYPLLEESVPFINAPLQWNAGYDGTGITIAVIDTGLDANHPFFDSRVVEEGCFLQAQIGTCPDGTSTMTGPGAAEPSLSHGTHVTGIMAGSSNDFSGVARAANIIALNTFDPVGGAPISDIIDALDYLYTLEPSYDIAAVNLSLGSGEFSAVCDGELPALAASIHQLLSVDIATIAASGNNGYLQAVNAPACISSAIAVGSVQDGSNGTIPDAVSSFSNSSPLLDLLAPGETVRSSYPDDEFDTLSGTSMSAPHVTGAFAIMYQLNSPSATVSGTLALLQNSGVPVTDHRNGLTIPRLNLEPTIIVDDGSSDVTASNGLCSLREAINNANTNSDTTGGDCMPGVGSSVDSILLTTDVTLDTIDSAGTGLPAISSSIILRGDGHTIERDTGAADSFRIFNVAANGTLRLFNVTISGGSINAAGGGIRNFGNLYLNRSHVINNSGNFGGGIFSNSFVSINDSTVNDNSGTNGGGIYSNSVGTLEIKDATIRGNTASTNGGGIYNGGNVSIVRSTVESNISTESGGGIYSDSSMTLVNVVVRGNDNTSSGNESLSYGAGIRISGGSASIYNSMITANYSLSDGAGIDNDGDLVVINSTIASNDGDAGIWNGSDNFDLINSIVWGNITDQIINDGSMSISYSGIEDGLQSISNTTALSGNITLSSNDTVFVNPVDALADAPTIDGDYHLHINSPVIGLGSNDAIPTDILDVDDDGNANEALSIDFEGDDRVIGNDVDMGADETDECNNVVFPYTATSSDGLRLAMNCANQNEGLGPTLDTIEIANDITLEVLDNVVDGNNGTPSVRSQIIINGNGHTVARADNATETFRVFHVEYDGDLTLHDITVTGGVADDGDPATSAYIESDGGGILNAGLLTISNSTITGNWAEGEGGAIFNILDESVLTIEGSLISHNSASLGGGISLDTGLFNLTASVVSNNTAWDVDGDDEGGGGGGIYNYSSTMVLSKSFITDNWARYGGGILNEGTSVAQGGTGGSRVGGVDPSGFAFQHSEISADGLLIADNHAEVDGGGILNTGELQLASSVIRDNYAGRDGGGVWNVQFNEYDDIETLGYFGGVNVAIIGNEAFQHGGGIANFHGGFVDIADNLVITGNKAGGNGGGIYNSSSHPDFNTTNGVYVGLINNTIAGNSATAGGGIFNNANSDFEILNSIVWGNSDQIDNSGGGTFDIGYSGIENYPASINGPFVDFGGNQNFSSVATIFVDPRSSGDAPTSLGDYRLAADGDNPAINAGDNSLLLDDLFDIDSDGDFSEQTPIDPDGDDRIIGGIVDMGMDELNNPNINAMVCATDMNARSAVDLIRAIICANQTASTTNTITIYGSISLRDVNNTTNGNNGLPVISSPIIIQTANPFIHQVIGRNPNSEDSFRIFYVGPDGVLTLKNIDIRGGVARNTNGQTAEDQRGGGIYNEGVLNIVNGRIVGNAASSNGGGIFGTGNSITTIHNSLISGNVAGIGGGGIDSNGQVTLRQITLAGNSGDSGIQGGNIMNIFNSIIWGNAAEQISVLGTLNIGASGVENGLPMTGGEVNELGGNQPLSPTANIFNNPQPPSNIPTTGGDYRLALAINSQVINGGDNGFIPNDVFDVDGDGDFDEELPTDFEGDPRVRGGKVDMGYDEAIDCASLNFPVTVNSVNALRVVIRCANINGLPDTINIGTSLSFVNVHSNVTGLPSITSDITINGNGNTLTRDANAPELRFFRVESGGTLTLQNIKLDGGFLSDRPGGAILNNQGTVNIFNSTIQANFAFAGGGVYNYNGNMHIVSSFIRGNKAVLFGGGIENEDGTTLIDNSIVSGNDSLFDGAGIDNYGGTLDMINTTIASNWGDAGIWNDHVLNITNSIVAWNEFDQIETVFGDVTLFHSAIQDGNAGFIGGGNVIDSGGNISVSMSDDIFVNPISAFNTPFIGGNFRITKTSVAINKGDNNSATNIANLTTDIDGNNRIQYVNVDMGAFESNFCTAIGFPYTVTTADELVRGIACANSTPATDTIEITGTISLTRVDNEASGNNGLPNVVRPLNIIGVGGDAVIQRAPTATDNFRLLHIGKNQTLTMQDVTLRNGNVVETNANISTDDDGGAILNRGNTNLINVLIHGNHAQGVGGGFYNLQGTSTMDNVTIANNFANFGGGIRVYTGTVTMENSLIHGNRASNGGAQIGNSATLNLQSTGLESLTTANFTGLGGNKGLSPNWNIFEAPEPAVNAPTIAGDYHLANLSKAVNAGDNSLVPGGINTDFEGDPRILNSVVDMGADERPFDLPLQNTNLVFNPDFTFASNNLGAWSKIGSIVADTSGTAVVNLQFPSTVDGWLRQIRGAYQLEIGLKMVAWVNVHNPDTVDRPFRFFMKDIVTGDSYICDYNVPANSTGDYYMQFLTTSDWEAMRIDVRPNFAGSPGLNINLVEVRYRPNAPFSENKVCISPSSDEAPIPSETELVTTTNLPPVNGGTEGGSCTALDWFDTNNWTGYLPTSEVQFVFDPFSSNLLSNGVYDVNGDGVGDTLYDALSYGDTSPDATLIREAVIAMLNDRADANHPEAWWAIEIDTVEALGQGENAMLTLAQQYALSNTTCTR